MSLRENLSKILIIDFGSQFTQLITRRIRELGVFSEIVSHKKVGARNIKEKNIRGIILSGGPLNVHQKDKFNFDKRILELGIGVVVKHNTGIEEPKVIVWLNMPIPLLYIQNNLFPINAIQLKQKTPK